MTATEHKQLREVAVKKLYSLCFFFLIITVVLLSDVLSLPEDTIKEWRPRRNLPLGILSMMVICCEMMKKKRMMYTPS